MFTAINRGYAAGEGNLDKESTTRLDLNRRQCNTSFLTELHKQHFTRYPTDTQYHNLYKQDEYVTWYLGNYDRRIRPYDKVDRLNVSINIYVSSFDSLEETSMDYRITFFLVSFSSEFVELCPPTLTPKQNLKDEFSSSQEIDTCLVSFEINFEARVATTC